MAIVPGCPKQILNNIFIQKKKKKKKKKSFASCTTLKQIEEYASFPMFFLGVLQ